MKIYKYEVPGLVPIGDNKVVDFNVQSDGKLYLWAWIVDPNSRYNRNFEVVGTGHDFYGFYLKSIHVGGFVWHLIEVD